MALEKLTLAEELVRSNKHHDAKCVLASIDNTQALSREQYGNFCILSAEVSLYLGDYHVDYLDSAIEIFRFRDETSQFGRAKYLRGWQQAALGQHRAAQETLLEAYAAFIRCEDKNGVVRVLNRLAYVLLQLGNVDSAAANLASCADLCRQLGRHDDALVADENAAYTYAMAGRLVESVKAYSGIALDVDNLQPKNRFQFYAMSAFSYALQGHTQSAQKNLDIAEPLCRQYARERGIYLENCGLVCLLEGNFEQAERSLDEGLRLSLELAPDSALVSQIKRLLADCYLGQKQYVLAQQTAAEALAVAEKIGQKVEIAACWRVFAQVSAHEGRTDEARDWFRTSLEQFNQISSRYELAVTRYLASCSGLFGQTEGIALLYLAKKYFETEQVTPYIDKVATALQSLQAPILPVRASQGSEPVQIIATNVEMMRILELARHLSRCNMTLLITGETGTGKDLLARYIHEHSGCSGRFVCQNVTTLPATMIESELFGHKRGSFTGAHQNRDGLIKQAECGTLFLNEIGEASFELQAKLLEVLETRRVRRVGDDDGQAVGFRLIAATNIDLREAVRGGKFRADLYHRLNHATITLVPLRDRLDDLQPLAQYFLACLGWQNGHSSQFAELVRTFSTYSWPGNVRELENLVKRLWHMERGNLEQMAHAALVEFASREERHLKTVLNECGGNKSKAARLLGVSEGTIRYRLKQGN